MPPSHYVDQTGPDTGGGAHASESDGRPVLIIVMVRVPDRGKGMVESRTSRPDVLVGET